jgi:hypothetical protein
MFHLDNAVWSQQAVLLPSANNPDFSTTFYGFSLALSYNGNIAAVGAQLQPTVSNGKGIVYVYERKQGIWSEHSIVKHQNDNTNAGFGAAVSLSDDGRILAVGDPEYNNGEGRAFVYEKSGNSYQETALIPATVLRGRIGHSVSVSGNGKVIAVGAPYTSDVVGNGGATYIFKKPGSIWQYDTKMAEANPKQEDAFGWDVSLDGSGRNALIGCHAGKRGSQVFQYNKGKAFLYTDKGTKGWTKNLMITPAVGNNGDGFGVVVSLSADANSYIIGGARSN